MKYSFNQKDMSVLKGHIGESLARHYMNDVTIPKLKKEYDFVFMDFASQGRFSEFLPLGFIDTALMMGRKVDWEDAWGKTNVRIEVRKSGEKLPMTEERLKLCKEHWKERHMENASLNIPRRVLRTYWERGAFPNPDLFDNTIKMLSLLEVATDGIIFKLNKTGATIGSFSRLKALSKWKTIPFSLGLVEGLSAPSPEEIPVVSGEMEVIEIKTDKGFIAPNQAESYKRTIAEGFPLRYFQVRFISFESNQFEVEEKLVEKVTELESILGRNYLH